jgi:hypothetical protein
MAAACRDYRGAATMLPSLPDADMLIADKGYDSDWFREALASLGIQPCIVMAIAMRPNQSAGRVDHGRAFSKTLLNLWF